MRDFDHTYKPVSLRRIATRLSQFLIKKPSCDVTPSRWVTVPPFLSMLVPPPLGPMDDPLREPAPHPNSPARKKWGKRERNRPTISTCSMPGPPNPLHVPQSGRNRSAPGGYTYLPFQPFLNANVGPKVADSPFFRLSSDQL